MFNSETVKDADSQTLLYAENDLRDVIALQEKSEKLYPGSCPKLGVYRDELALIHDEQRRRRGADLVRVTLTRADVALLLSALELAGQSPNAGRVQILAAKLIRDST